MMEYRTKISLTIPESMVSEVDHLVTKGNFPNRSVAFEIAMNRLLRHYVDAHIEAEAAKLDRHQEKVEAEEGMKDFSRIVLK